MEQYTFRLVGSRGCEILNADGTVVAWAVNPVTAAIIVALLNLAERKGLGAILTDYCWAMNQGEFCG